MFRFLWKPDLITAPALARPADGPEIVFHLGQRGMDRTGQKLGLYTEIFWSLKRQGHVVRAVRVSRESRIAARNDNRFHIFFHGRLEGARFLNFKDTYLKNYYYCDPRGFCGFSSVVDQKFDSGQIPAADAHGFFATLCKRHIGRKMSKFQQPATGSILPKGAIAIFLQIERDIVLRLARFSMRDMVDMILAARGNRPVIIKRHPKCQDPAIAAFLDRIHAPDAGIHVVDANLHDIFGAASHVAVINSGTGFEALLHKKPVLLFGQSDYHHAAWPINDMNDLRRGLLADGPPINEIEKFLYWFLRQQLLSPLHGDMGRQIAERVLKQGYPLER